MDVGSNLDHCTPRVSINVRGQNPCSLYMRWLFYLQFTNIILQSYWLLLKMDLVCKLVCIYVMLLASASLIFETLRYPHVRTPWHSRKFQGNQKAKTEGGFDSGLHVFCELENMVYIYMCVFPKFGYVFW